MFPCLILDLMSVCVDLPCALSPSAQNGRLGFICFNVHRTVSEIVLFTLSATPLDRAVCEVDVVSVTSVPCSYFFEEVNSRACSMCNPTSSD